MSREVHVAVGVVIGADGKILIAQRAASAHQGGLWEFPGGKVSSGESVEQALVRELQEELAIHVNRTKPLIKISHDYGDKKVLLDVHSVTGFSGVPTGNEGQPIQWVAPEQLTAFNFPKANRAIITALQLPERLMITGEAPTEEDFLQRIEQGLQRGIGLLQLRVPDGTQSLSGALVGAVQALCKQYGARLLLNTSPALFAAHPADGLHLNRHQLALLDERPVGKSILLGASCHNREEVLLAKQLEVDYLVLSPVAPTPSHPDAEPMGWEAFESLAVLAACPVFALGGMRENDLALIKQHAGHGIAAISAWW